MKERKRESRKSSTHRHVEQNHPAMALSYANLEETTFINIWGSNLVEP